MRSRLALPVSRRAAGYALCALVACADEAPDATSATGTAGRGDAAAPGPSGTAGGPSAPAPPLGASVDGIATYYAATGAGNCSFDASPGDLMVAAMNAEQYAASAACGSCVDIRGPKGNVRVRIVDQCPECKRGHLDLSKEAFARIADVAAGRVTIRWTPVRCDIVTPLSYRIKEGSSQYWTAIQVRDHALPIAKLELQQGGAWVALPRESYNYFVRSSGVGAGAYRLRVTSTTGAALEDAMPAVQEGAIVTGKAQFP